MKVDYSYYELEPIKALNGFAGKKIRKGLYLRVDDLYYLDYCPWPEFGDASIDKFLKDLKSEGLSLVMQSLLKLEKKQANINFQTFSNHKKVKVSSTDEIIRFLRSEPTKKKYRFDLNNLSSYQDIVKMWGALSELEKDLIGYIEDPYQLDIEGWEKLACMGIPLACDRNSKTTICYDFEIFKPNVDLFKKRSTTQVFSSYMGGDLGRYHSYLALLEWGDLTLEHGIDTPGLFKEQLSLFQVMDDGRRKINEEAVHKMYEKLRTLEWESLL